MKSNFEKEQDNAQYKFGETAQSLVWTQGNDEQVYEEPGHFSNNKLRIS